jgi:hypothetical protein
MEKREVTESSRAVVHTHFDALRARTALFA